MMTFTVFIISLTLAYIIYYGGMIARDIVKSTGEKESGEEIYDVSDMAGKEPSVMVTDPIPVTLTNEKSQDPTQVPPRQHQSQVATPTVENQNDNSSTGSPAPNGANEVDKDINDASSNNGASPQLKVEDDTLDELCAQSQYELTASQLKERIKEGEANGETHSPAIEQTIVNSNADVRL